MGTHTHTRQSHTQRSMDDSPFTNLFQDAESMIKELQKKQAKKHKVEDVKEVLECLDTNIKTLKKECKMVIQLKEAVEKVQGDIVLCKRSVSEVLCKVKDCKVNIQEDCLKFEETQYNLQQAAEKYFGGDPSMLEKLPRSKKPRTD